MMLAANSVAPIKITKQPNKRTALPVQGIQERTHGGRIARQFEKAHNAKDQHRPQIGG